MGTFDTIRFLEDHPDASCAAGHRLHEFQTKDLEEAMGVFFVSQNRLYRGEPSGMFESGESRWRVEGGRAVHETRYALKPVQIAQTLRIYDYCEQCEPILIRCERVNLYGDLVDERKVFVELLLRVSADEPIRLERIKGSREEEAADLKAHGLYVLGDDEPLAVAHRELKRAKAAAEAARKRSYADF